MNPLAQETFIYKSEHSLRNKAIRALWDLTWLLLFRPSPRIFRSWRRFLLRLFGAQLSKTAAIAPSARIWAPWNLEMEAGSSLSDHAICYNIDLVTLKKNAIVSQYAYLCTSSHDVSRIDAKLISKPIEIGQKAWVGTDAYINMGVKVGDYAVVGARASVFRDVKQWHIVGGSPAKFIKKREIETSSDDPA